MIRIGQLLLSLTLSLAMQAATFTNVSTASGNATLAPDSAATAMGTDFPVEQTAQEDKLPLPTTLGGIGVQVVDSAGTARMAGLYYVSAAQINYVIPTGTALGAATVNIVTGNTTAMSAPAQIAAAAPALFSANMDGKGVAAATAVAVAVPSSIQNPVAVFLCLDHPGSCRAVPINPGVDRPVYLSFYGTGIRDAKTVSVTIAGIPVPVLYAGPQGDFPGLDQVNVPLILSLRGAGLADVIVTADGAASNAVQISVQ